MKALAIHDLSCYSKSSLTVVLPVLEAMGVETAVIPTAVLSTQTDGFSENNIRDLSMDVRAHYEMIKSHGAVFSAVFSGYLASKEQIPLLEEIFSNEVEALKVLDPAFADSGNLYGGKDDEFVCLMKELLKSADIITPNLTEASFLSSSRCMESYSNSDIEKLCEKLSTIGPSKFVITSVPLSLGLLANVAYADGQIRIFSYEDLMVSFPGSGDLFATLLTGFLLNGFSFFSAVKESGDICFEQIRDCLNSSRQRRLGVRLDKAISMISRRLL